MKQLDISFAVPGLPFDGDTLKQKALGGSETAAIYMAKNLSSLGHVVNVFCNTDSASTDDEGVRYIPLPALEQYQKGTICDVLIAQRAPELFGRTNKSRLNVLWMHDLALTRQAQTYKAALWNVDFAFVLSEFMRDQYKTVYGLKDADLRIARNGVDLSAFENLPAVPRDRFHVVYAARPERGLDVLLNKIMPALIERDKRFHLSVCGYGNTVEHWREFYAQCDRAMAALGTEHAVHIGELTKRELYALYSSAGCYVYPTPSEAMQNFAEISCISAMECQAAGLPIVTSDRGALPETVVGGALIEGDPWSKKYIGKFVDAVYSYATDDAKFNEAQTSGLAHASTLDWRSEAERWTELFEEEIKQRAGKPDSIVRDMYRTSDIVAAKAWIKERPSDFEDVKRLKQLLAPFDFMDEKDGYKEQYERIGATHEDYVYAASPREPRYFHLKNWLHENRKTVKHVLDYGCAHGGYAINLAKDLPHLQIHGVDIDKFSIEMASEWAKKFEVDDRAKFQVWTHNMKVPDAAPTYDAVLLQEVLEHVPEPWDVVEKTEARVAKGGKVYITVPFGPWEYESYDNYPWRCHIWHFDRHDLTDMLGKKNNLIIDSYYHSTAPKSGEGVGWWIVQYDADHEPIGKVDLERKRWLTRPRQTVSVSMIVGGNTVIETLLWCLRSLYHMADEFVLADCGMPDSQLQIAINLLDNSEPHARWPEKIRVVPGINPREVGFERARNMSLEQCTMDWVFWVDTDERLLDQANLHKYLRNNRFTGYGIRQHHLAIDVPLKPDMPVRLFRREREDEEGRKMQFFGALHEHPEFALNEGPGDVIVLSDAHLAHIGYLTESIRQNRFTRNYPLLKMDEERYPERLLQKFFLMRDKVQIARFHLQQTGGKVDEQTRALMREVVQLGQKYFVGKPSYMNSDAIAYYSEALEILGEGFSTSFSVDASLDKAKANGQTTYRFANKEDFLAEFNRRLDEKVDPLLGEYY